MNQCDRGHDLADDVDSGTFTGADEGEGLDFSGQFIYAVDVGGRGGVTIGDAVFTADSETQDVTIMADNKIANWALATEGPLDWGDSRDDDALETIMQSVRWSASPSTIVIIVPLNVGHGPGVGIEYRLQLLFHEECCDRGFNVLVNGQMVMEGYSPQRDQGGLSGGGRPGAYINYDFVATTPQLMIQLSGGSTAEDAQFADTNPILNAFT
eukprot:SAG31_NODE_8662_length_1411_cov_0.836890_2_plen_211_part_00